MTNKVRDIKAYAGFIFTELAQTGEVKTDVLNRWTIDILSIAFDERNISDFSKHISQDQLNHFVFWFHEAVKGIRFRFKWNFLESDIEDLTASIFWRLGFDSQYFYDLSDETKRKSTNEYFYIRNFLEYDIRFLKCPVCKKYPVYHRGVVHSAKCECRSFFSFTECRIIKKWNHSHI